MRFHWGPPASRRPLHALCLILSVMVATACDDGGGGGGQGGAGGGPGAGGAGGDPGSGGGSAVMCGGASPTFPTFDKTCATASDCALKFHMVDCCGSMVAIGVNAAESSAFDTAEAACEAMYPGCGCAPQATTADDGQSSYDPSVFHVDCVTGECSTYVQ